MTLNRRIRSADPSEAPFLTQLTIRSKAHWGYSEHFMTVATPELEFRVEKFVPDFLVYLLEVDQTRVGFCSLLRVDDNTIELHVDWLAIHKPDHDLSVFVHLLDKDGTMIGQADESAPVYGWRPLTTWQAGEVVSDVYALPRLANADSIAYGLYRQLPSGEFQNEYSFSVAVDCG